MPRTCTVCANTERDAIDHAILGNDSLRRIATQFSLSEASVRRHKADHLPPHLAKAEAAKEAAQADDLLTKVTGIEREARRIAKKAEAAGDLRTAMSGIRELARLVELLAKLRGELNEGQTVNILISPQWHELRAVLVNALIPYPHARIAVTEALGRLHNGHGA